MTKQSIVTPAGAPREHPILFKGAMMRANLAGRKTQTRRLMKPQPHADWHPEGGLVELHDLTKDDDWEKYPLGYGLCTDEGDQGYRFPYGNIGDTLWSRETWRVVPTEQFNSDFAVEYAADGSQQSWCDLSGIYEHYVTGLYADGYKPTQPVTDKWPHWKPSIFLPRAFCRHRSTITSVRSEFLREITEADAIAEGICQPPTGEEWWSPNGESCPLAAMSLIAAYRALWDSINAKPRAVYNPDKTIESYISYPWNAPNESETFADETTFTQRMFRGKPWRIVSNPRVWVIEYAHIDAEGKKNL